MAILTAERLSKQYGGSVPTWALKDATFQVEKGEFLGIMGPSGSGKTTLLNLLAGIDQPTSGTVYVEGVNLTGLSDDRLVLFRRRSLGFVFQDFNLLNALTIRENIAIPVALDRMPVAKIEERLAVVSRQLGIQGILDKRPFEVSGGEQQRSAIARAIIHSPAMVFADEPTGNLDSKAANDVMRAFGDLNQSGGTGILMVTHDPFAASFCKRILFIRDGRVHSQLHRGESESRSSFFQEIIDSLRVHGGELNDVIPARSR
ncbi:MAG: ABC transporter ATP-binding protein [Bacillota bacterium]|jgi:ABC-type lipoprotein export system ATPase subunit